MMDILRLGVGVGVEVGFGGIRLFSLKGIPSDQSVFLHNFLISHDHSLISLRIALSIPEFYDSEGDLQKRASIIKMLK